MKNIYLNTILFLFLFLACNSAERESSIPVINPKTAMRQEIKLSAIADEVTYIPNLDCKVSKGYLTHEYKLEKLI